MAHNLVGAPVLQVQVIEDGASNKREILKLSFPQCIMPYFM
jgi:hypothetical protein